MLFDLKSENKNVGTWLMIFVKCLMTSNELHVLKGALHITSFFKIEIGRQRYQIEFACFGRNCAIERSMSAMTLSTCICSCWNSL